MSALRAYITLLVSLAFLVLPALSSAGPFEVAVSPSRFELGGVSEGRIGQSLTIFNVGASASEVSIRTLDWRFSAQGELTFHDELLPESCRPWVTLERRGLKIGMQDKAQFRFQVDIPPNTPRGECRFMIAIEGVEPAQAAILAQQGMSLNFPVSGRIAVPVYIALNGAEPRLKMKNIALVERQGKRFPAITVTNAGDAHGRLAGVLSARDSKGTEFELSPEGTPILPGQTRTLLLQPQAPQGGVAGDMAYPLKVKGLLDWERGGFKIDSELR